jgi:hypothetical protein
MGRACCRGVCWFIFGFLRADTERDLVGISVGIDSNRRQKLFQIQLVMVLGDCRPGAPIGHLPSSADVQKFGHDRVSISNE